MKNISLDRRLRFENISNIVPLSQSISNYHKSSPCKVGMIWSSTYFPSLIQKKNKWIEHFYNVCGYFINWKEKKFCHFLLRPQLLALDFKSDFFYQQQTQEWNRLSAGSNWKGPGEGCNGILHKKGGKNSELMPLSCEAWWRSSPLDRLSLLTQPARVLLHRSWVTRRVRGWNRKGQEKSNIFLSLIAADT